MSLPQSVCICCWRTVTHSRAARAHAVSLCSLQATASKDSKSACLHNNPKYVLACLHNLAILYWTSALIELSCSRVFRVSRSVVYAVMTLEFAMVWMHCQVGQSPGRPVVSSEPTVGQFLMTGLQENPSQPAMFPC